MEILNKYIILTKVEDKMSRGHPNIGLGSTRIQGYCKNYTIGEQLYLYPLKDIEDYPTAWTSRVEKVDLDNMEIHTKNSVYKIEVDNE